MALRALNLGVANDIIKTCDEMVGDAEKRIHSDHVASDHTLRLLSAEVSTLAKMVARLAEHARG